MRACLLIPGMIISFGIAALADAAEPHMTIGPVLDEAVFLFGGWATEQNFDQSAVLWEVTYEDNFLLGAGYQKFIFEHSSSFRVGGELGLAARFGEVDSLEAWGGAVVRYDINLFGKVTLSPAFTMGLSAVTGAMDGRESYHEAERDGDASLLVYLGPEINLSLPDRPELELFWRIHHRSGAWQTFGSMTEGMNANVVGARWRY